MIKINKDEYFLLFACCIPVKGAVRSIICDLQRNAFMYVPNEIGEIFMQQEVLDLATLTSEEQEQLKLYITYLTEEGYGFTTDNPEAFPPINLANNDYPELLKNVIVDVDTHSNHNFEDIASQISQLRCSAIEIRYFYQKPLAEILEDLKAFTHSTIRSLLISIPYTPETTLETLNDVCFANKRIQQMIVHSAPFDKVEQLDMQTMIIFSQEVVKDETHCGNINPFYFQTSIDFFKESLVVNNCLDKKIGIDKDGNIKNCPSMKTVYGHSKQDKIADILKLDSFQKIGRIKKDDIEVCRDCEFRYICMDCRAYTINTDNVYAKPQKCKYDPYQAKWV